MNRDKFGGKDGVVRDGRRKAEDSMRGIRNNDLRVIVNGSPQGSSVLIVIDRVLVHTQQLICLSESIPRAVICPVNI